MGFGPRLKLELHGSRVISDAGLLAFPEVDEVLGLTDLAGRMLTDCRSGRNSRHALEAHFRQSVFSRVAGYENVNDADRLGHNAAMRWVVANAVRLQLHALAYNPSNFLHTWLCQRK